MKKEIWSYTVGFGAFSAFIIGIVASILLAIQCFVEWKTVWDVIGGLGWSICVIGQVCTVVELSRNKTTVSE